MILLDTSVLIEMFRMKDKAATFFYQLSERNESFAISTVTHYEILRGSYQTSQDAFWMSFLKSITTIPFDISVSNKAVQLYKVLKSQNSLIDLADLLIAATALAHDLDFATQNVKHFGRIADLRIIPKTN